MTAVNKALVPLHRPASSNSNSPTGTSTARASHQQSGARPATAGSRVPCSHGESRLKLAAGGRGGRRRSRSAPSPPQLPRSLCTSVYGKAKAASRTATTGRAGSAVSSGRLPQQQQGKKKKEKSDERSSLKTVRAMLPWWRDSAPDGRPGNDDDDRVAATTTADTTRLKQKHNVTTPGNIAAAATLLSGDATTATTTTTTAAAAREKNVQLPGTSGEFLQQRSRSSASSPLPTTPRPQHTPHDDNNDQLNEEAQQQHTSTRGFNSIAASSIESAYDAYTDCSNLFENPPPSMPCVDQYVRRESIMYEAITKRARSRALPVKEPDSVLRVNKKGGNAPRDPLDDESLDADVDPSALLFGDEDIDKVRLSPLHLSWLLIVPQKGPVRHNRCVSTAPSLST